MKLLIAVVPHRLVRALRRLLCAEGYGFTELAGSGGFFREGNATLLIVLDEARVQPLLALLQEHCRPRTATVSLPGAANRGYPDPVGNVENLEVGGVLVFLLNVEQVVHV